MKTLALSIIFCAFALAACTPADLTTVQRNTICTALQNPIKYNTYNKASARYAAWLLAADLKTRNQVGQALRCPQYALHRHRKR